MRIRMNFEDFHEVSIQVPWGHISGRWYGDQLQRPLVAVHGWLDNCGTYARLAPLLTPHTNLLCIDLPGHGYSSHYPEGMVYHHMDYVAVLLQIMKAYKWQKISLMGHSMGGIVSFIFAALYPERVDMLITLDIVHQIYFKPTIEPQILRTIFDRLSIENERRLKNSWMNEPPSYTYSECVRLLHEASNYSVGKEDCKFILERNISKSKKYPDKFYFSRDGRLKNLQEFNTPDELAELMARRICSNKDVPYLVIRGGASHLISANNVSKIVPFIQNLNRNFEYHVVEGGTHHLHLSHSHEVANIIIEFLKRNGGRESSKNNDDEQTKSEAIVKSKL